MPLPVRGLAILIVISGWLSHVSSVWASSVVINEIHPGEEWVELYNPEGQDLTGWTIGEMSGSEQKFYNLIDSLIDNPVYDIFSFSGSKLNNDGDIVILKNQEGESVDEYSYFKAIDGGFHARIPDGGDWSTLSSPTKGGSNGGASLSPSPSPSPSPSSSSSSSSVSYRINEVKDEDGNTLSSVKVYVDGVYLKHYAPETLTFCDGCSCDSLTSCDFGGHTIKLEKNGYQDWEETRNITSGGSYQVNPIMEVASSESTSSSEDTASPSPQVLGTTAKTKTSKKTVFGQSIDSESMLGEFASFSGEVLGATESEEKEAEEEVEEGQNYNWLVPLGLSGSGLVLLGAASFPFVKPRVVSFLKKRKP